MAEKFRIVQAKGNRTHFELLIIMELSQMMDYDFYSIVSKITKIQHDTYFERRRAGQFVSGNGRQLIIEAVADKGRINFFKEIFKKDVDTPTRKLAFHVEPND